MFRHARLGSGLNTVGKISDKVIPPFFFKCIYLFFKPFEYFRMFHDIS